MQAIEKTALRPWVKTYPFWDGTGDHELPSWAIVVHAQQYM